jgi:hypothetical protein
MSIPPSPGFESTREWCAHARDRTNKMLCAAIMAIYQSTVDKGLYLRVPKAQSEVYE